VGWALLLAVMPAAWLVVVRNGPEDGGRRSSGSATLIFDLIPRVGL
jgi:hypothetical protein